MNVQELPPPRPTERAWPDQVSDQMDAVQRAVAAARRWKQGQQRAKDEQAT